MAQYAVKNDSFWRYKEKMYRVDIVHEYLLSQDSKGKWVPTVVYETETETVKRFARPITDFQLKFEPY